MAGVRVLRAVGQGIQPRQLPPRERLGVGSRRHILRFPERWTAKPSAFTGASHRGPGGGPRWRATRVTEAAAIRSHRPRAAIAVFVVAGAALAASLLVQLPDPFPAIERATASLGAWLYVLVAAVVLLETSVGLGLASPGEAVLAVAGAAAARDGVSLALLLAVVGAFGVLGDSVAWLLGRRYGHAMLLRIGRRVGITAGRLERVEDLYARRGGWVLIGGRFVGVVRVFAPFVAGAAAMPYRRFLPFDVVGIAIWGSGYVLAGYVFAGSLAQATGRIGQVGLLLALLSAAVAWRVNRSTGARAG